MSQLFNVVEAALRLPVDLQMRARGYETEMIGMEDGHALRTAVAAAFVAGDAPGAEEAMRHLIAAVADVQAGLAGPTGMTARRSGLPLSAKRP